MQGTGHKAKGMEEEVRDQRSEVRIQSEKAGGKNSFLATDCSRFYAMRQALCAVRNELTGEVELVRAWTPKNIHWLPERRIDDERVKKAPG